MSSLVTFFAPKKVTRAPARKRSQALHVNRKHQHQQFGKKVRYRLRKSFDHFSSSTNAGQTCSRSFGCALATGCRRCTWNTPKKVTRASTRKRSQALPTNPEAPSNAFQTAASIQHELTCAPPRRKIPVFFINTASVRCDTA